MFLDSAGGLPGSDDLGATSSWAVFAYLRLYPEIPGVGGLAFNTPTFPDVTLKLGNRELRIRVAGAPENVYIHGVALDGKPVRASWLDWEELHQSKTLDFTLGAEPSNEVLELPPSFAPTQH
jgi:putative alpha-1,2-mannosidase